MRINDRLARYILDNMNAGLSPTDPNPDEGWFVDGPGEGNPDPAVLICDPDFETRIEIIETGNHEEDKALGHRVVALINTYFLKNESSLGPSSSKPEMREAGPRR
ncbi:hypothetical protein [Microvirga tunisiensis]|uniref:Uncharacterized protein n=1 Tax=Microvirga tunisiensis TaxID=2108360 RepID=A0A5N7MBI3_9HYPH|nr:hypothetical protein [Microvirga tunisiensis]MPR08171.1 hypothetical protein [Microvirga tunisiensis]MPR24117.1 hypothetical protein [Microvirga tunisiensis]